MNINYFSTGLGVRVMVFNSTFNNISVVSSRSVSGGNRSTFCAWRKPPTYLYVIGNPKWSRLQKKQKAHMGRKYSVIVICNCMYGPVGHVCIFSKSLFVI
jgi:hypothetical protein